MTPPRQPTRRFAEEADPPWEPHVSTSASRTFALSWA